MQGTSSPQSYCSNRWQRENTYSRAKKEAKGKRTKRAGSHVDLSLNTAVVKNTAGRHPVGSVALFVAFAFSRQIDVPISRQLRSGDALRCCFDPSLRVSPHDSNCFSPQQCSIVYIASTRFMYFSGGALQLSLFDLHTRNLLWIVHLA